VPVLNAWVRKSFDLPEFNQTHNAYVFIQVQNICFTGTYHLILFVLTQIKLGIFLPIQPCAV